MRYHVIGLTINRVDCLKDELLRIECTGKFINGTCTRRCDVLLDIGQALTKQNKTKKGGMGNQELVNWNKWIDQSIGTNQRTEVDVEEGTSWRHMPFT